MALLDKEPRSASIFAIEPTQLLRLAQAPFYELLSDRPEIATGIIHVLMGYIRNLNRRLADAA
jgi:CRP-like cAMP-binding protein